MDASSVIQTFRSTADAPQRLYQISITNLKSCKIATVLRNCVSHFQEKDSQSLALNFRKSYSPSPHFSRIVTQKSVQYKPRYLKMVPWRLLPSVARAFPSYIIRKSVNIRTVHRYFIIFNCQFSAIAGWFG